MPLRLCLAVTRSVSDLPLPRSFLPSILPICTAVLQWKNEICPFKVATATSSPFGLYVTYKPSAVNCIVSCKEPLSIAFHIFSVLSQDTDTNSVLVTLGLNAKLAIGPSCPLNI